MDTFKEFKRITGEEFEIIKRIEGNAKITNSTTLLDIGGNDGTISKKLQSNTNNITLVDIDEFDLKSSVKFVKSSWEAVKIKEKFDMVIASHVWGHFGYNETQKAALDKALKCKKESGKLFLCYNTNSDLMRKLVNFSKDLFGDFQYDYFDESLLAKLNYKEELFSVHLKADSFEKLAELCWILIIADKEIYNLQIKKIEEFLRSELTAPEFKIEQKIVIIS